MTSLYSSRKVHLILAQQPTNRLGQSLYTIAGQYPPNTEESLESKSSVEWKRLKSSDLFK